MISPLQFQRVSMHNLEKDTDETQTRLLKTKNTWTEEREGETAVADLIVGQQK